MPEPTIIRGSDYMFSTIYEGNGGGQKVGNFVPFTDNGTIAKSVMLDHGSSSYLERTQDTVSGDDNKRKATFSCWFKPSGVRFGNETVLFCAAPSGRLFARFDTSNRLVFRLTNSTTEYQTVTNRTFEDTSKFYHLLWQVDASQSTASNRSRVWIDGSEITSWASAAYPAQNTDIVGLSDGTTIRMSSLSHATLQYFDGYLAEFNLVAGSIVDVSTFGLTDTSTGRWIPKTLTGITYGTNGFRCEFANSAGQIIGQDTSGNGNHFDTLNGIGTDHITTDSPTQNHCTLDKNVTAGTVTLSDGNLILLGSGSSVYGSSRSTIELDVDDPTGYYFEARNTGSARDNINIGFQDAGTALSATAYGGSNFYGLVSRGSGGSNQYWRILGGSTDVTTSVAHADNDWIGVAIKQGKVWFAINNTYVFSGNPVTGATPFLDISAFAKRFYITIECFQNNKLECNFGQKSLNYSAPSGYVSIQQDNLPETDKSIPDLVWIKNRDATDNHQIYDSSRGPLLDLHPNTTGGESTTNDGLQKFLKGGFAVEDDVSINTVGESYVAWNWVANGGTTSANTDGSGATYASTIQANQTAGFSIVRFTPGSSSGKVAHGLSQAPEMIIMKDTSRSVLWLIYHKDIGTGKYVQFTTAAAATNSTVYSTAPTASLFDPGTGYTSTSSYGATVAYCWHSVPGFSKFGKYEGNSNANGPFINTGFAPSFVLIKNIDATQYWMIQDNVRWPFNPTDKPLFPANTDGESSLSAQNIDFLSNGFKCRGSSATQNGATMIYMAFAEHPFIGNGTNPVTAR